MTSLFLLSTLAAVASAHVQIVRGLFSFYFSPFLRFAEEADHVAFLYRRTTLLESGTGMLSQLVPSVVEDSRRERTLGAYRTPLSL
jgi:hypothetical protein